MWVFGLTCSSSSADWGPQRQSSTIDFALCLGATATEKLAARTKVKNTGHLEKKDEAVANVIWRFLELRGWASFPIQLFWCDSQVHVLG